MRAMSPTENKERLRLSKCQMRKTNNSWSHGSEIPLQARSFGVLCDRHLVLDGGLPGLRHVLGRFKISDNGAICDYSPRSISIREIYDEA